MTNQTNPFYFDGRGVEQLAKRIQENAKGANSIIVKPEIPEGTVLQLRYPCPHDAVFQK